MHSPQTIFVEFGLSSKVHRVDCCFVSSSYAQIHDLSSVMILWSTAIVFFQLFYTPIDTNLFLSDSGIQREQICFAASCSCNIECMLVAEMPKSWVHQCNLIVIMYIESCKKWSHENVRELIPIFFANLIFSSHCKLHKWRLYIKTSWVRLSLKVTNSPTPTTCRCRKCP